MPLPDLCLFFHGLIQDCGHIMLCDMDLAHTSDDIAAAAAVVDTRACAGSVLSGGGWAWAHEQRRSCCCRCSMCCYAQGKKCHRVCVTVCLCVLNFAACICTNLSSSSSPTPSTPLHKHTPRQHAPVRTRHPCPLHPSPLPLLPSHGLTLALPGAANNGNDGPGFWGTLEYVAPEVVTHGAAAYSPSSDWWGLGVLLYELLLGLVPWDGSCDDAIVEQIRAADVVWPPRGVVRAHFAALS